MHFQNETEPIFSDLRGRCDVFARHPLFTAAAEGAVPIEILHEFAFHQYSDSILWVPMLSLMKAKAVRSTRLARAIGDNIACETGLSGPSHVGLAEQMLRSLGHRDLDRFPTETFAAAASYWVSEEFARYREPEVAGWLLAAETLVPVMFAKMHPSFARLEGCDTLYFTQHIAVDDDEHAVWMSEAVAEVVSLYGPRAIEGIMHGMREAHDEALEVPDALFARLSRAA